jgi:hypothetical protein
LKKLSKLPQFRRDRSDSENAVTTIRPAPTCRSHTNRLVDGIADGFRMRLQPNSDHRLAWRDGQRCGGLLSLADQRPAVIQFRELCRGQLDSVPSQRRQVGFEETAPQQIQRIGAADDDLAAPVQPVQHRLLLVRRELVGTQTVPQQIGDGRPRQPLCGQRHTAIRGGQDDAIVHRPLGQIPLANTRRIDRIEPFQVPIAIGIVRQHNEEELVRRHRRGRLVGSVNLPPTASCPQRVPQPDGRRSRAVGAGRQIGNEERGLQIAGLAFGQHDRTGHGHAERRVLDGDRLPAAVGRGGFQLGVEIKVIGLHPLRGRHPVPRLDQVPRAAVVLQQNLQASHVIRVSPA